MPYPVADLAGYLEGVWRAERRIEDRRTGQNGRFTGTVAFTRVPSADPAAPTGDGTGVVVLESREEGELALEGQEPRPVYRNHTWRVRGERAEVCFDDGRRFHSLSLASGADTPSHWCEPDQYTGEFAAPGPAELEWTWSVSGPAKNLTLATRLTRELPVIAVSAVQLTTADGGLVLVRKRGTTAFMQPGGKPEPGETPLEAARRELAEELGLDLPAEAFRFQTAWRGRPANEAGFELYSENFAAEVPAGTPYSPAAEIEDLVVLSPAAQRQALDSGRVAGSDGQDHALAPLLRERILPDLLG
ncbi:DUF6314 family protein [Arthrobacter sp. UM1]|uniref:DUF6314 family protein n=1 Tax=Arthrobacter sp. UM1 TaxID=2766776 RepID=UPI001CF70154|nr:DUF6314 family protein [Arthrobacter sp. UM1]MCB4207851.1 NUDIX domain-containing protein [Arthrobacter sp. UM1]